jgi:surface polysaccharide O-acyltransferase-like enzyme
MTAGKTRDSNIELLRVLASMAVIMLHFNSGGAFSEVKLDSANGIILYILEGISICSVDLFVLISGFFLSKTFKRKSIKPVMLIFEVIVVNELVVVGNFFRGGGFLPMIL